MGDGTGTGGDTNQYSTMTLDQPWGAVVEKVRIFPPCQVKKAEHRGDPVVVFIKSAPAKAWKRKRVGYFDYFPSAGFVAWDDKNGEYAWHEVGTIDVPSAVDPTLSTGSSHSDAVSAHRQRRPIPRPNPSLNSPTHPKRPRRRFMDWWTSKSGANDTPEFLRKDRNA